MSKLIESLVPYFSTLALYVTPPFPPEIIPTGSVRSTAGDELSVANIALWIAPGCWGATVVAKWMMCRADRGGDKDLAESVHSRVFKTKVEISVESLWWLGE